MPTHASPMQAVAAQAAIGQGKVTQIVEYAITGDTENDLIAAIMACFYQQENSNGPRPFNEVEGQRMAQRVCEYLAQRFRAMAEASQRNIDAATRLAQYGAAAHLAPPQPMPVPPLWYSTTGGTTAMPGQPCNDLHDIMHSAKPYSFEEMKRRMQADMIKSAANSIHGPEGDFER